MKDLDDIEQFFHTCVAELQGISQATRAQYLGVYKRLRPRMTDSLPHTWPGFTKPQWLHTRAALTWVARTRGLQCIRAARAIDTEPERRRLLREVLLCRLIIETYPRVQPGRKAGGPRPRFVRRPARTGAQKKRGGKSSVRELRTDAAVQQLIESGYSDPRRGVDRRLQLAVLLATGARPEEFERGVHLTLTKPDAMLVSIHGAKRRPGGNGVVGHGQTQRWFTVSALRRSVPGRCIYEALHEAGGELVVKDSGRALREAVRRAGRRAFGPRTTVTAYSCRHYFSSGLRAAGLPEEAIAAAMGQQSTSSGRNYAGARLAGQTKRSIVRDVRASERVRVIPSDRSFLDRGRGAPERGGYPTIEQGG